MNNEEHTKPYDNVVERVAEKPVAWRYRWRYGNQPWEYCGAGLPTLTGDGWEVQPLYAAPARCDAQSASVVTAAKALLVEVERTTDKHDWLAPIADLKLAVALSETKPAQGDANLRDGEQP